MTHLTDLELVDAVEDALPFARRSHAETCASCRGRIDDLRATLAEAADAPMPEPSPLFWTQFSARVRDGIESSGQSVPGTWSSTWPSWLRHDGLTWAISGALVAVLVLGAVWRVTAPAVPPQGVDRIAPRTSAELDVEPADPDADPAWAVVRTVADEVQWNDAVVAGIGAQPDAAERAARSLSAAERSELVRLLLAEAKRPGA